MRYVRKYIECEQNEHEIVNRWIENNDVPDDEKYNESNVRKYLRKVYHGCCAFCECNPETSSFFEIDHFYPKSITNPNSKHNKEYLKQYQISEDSPDSFINDAMQILDLDENQITFHKEIKNLNYTCPRCNKLKGKLSVDGILSPNYRYKDQKWVDHADNVEERIYYIGPLLYYPEDEKEGYQTIEMFDLNGEHKPGRLSRSYLVRHRSVVFAWAFEQIDEMKEIIKGYQKAQTDPEKISKKLRKKLLLFYSLFLEDGCPYVTMIYQNFWVQLRCILGIFKTITS